MASPLTPPSYDRHLLILHICTQIIGRLNIRRGIFNIGLQHVPLHFVAFW
ncbi:hypothetical protein G6011_04800, partial [Alternaria panax]